jgi:hypothetical protein
VVTRRSYVSYFLVGVSGAVGAAPFAPRYLIYQQCTYNRPLQRFQVMAPKMNDEHLPQAFNSTLAGGDRHKVGGSMNIRE